ncbi:MAG: GyrI-like domain-containing protein [Clostridiales bacterium]|jgi:effector-binding domain-containing protein|nr:GyrI-like domain-containing protein [Clostridiales bacterium]
MEIKLIEQKPLTTLAVRETASGAELPRVISAGFARVYDYIVKTGAQIIDAPYAAYINMAGDSWDIEIGFPVARETPENGSEVCVNQANSPDTNHPEQMSTLIPKQHEIFPSVIPAGRAAAALHKGSYAGLEAVYGELFKWVGDNGLKQSGAPYDRYLNDPSVTPEDELLTNVVIPVI